MDNKTIKRLVDDAKEIYWKDEWWTVDEKNDKWVILQNEATGDFTYPTGLEELYDAKFYKRVMLKPEDYADAN